MTPQRPRLLLATSEITTVGGSATASYDLFRRMAAEGADAHFVNLVDEDDAAYYELVIGPDAGNPARLAGVHTCRLHGTLYDPHPELAALIDAIDPDVLVGFGFIASRILKEASPRRRVAYVTGTCRQAQDSVTSGRARDAVALQAAFERDRFTPRIINASERRAVETCDLIITHSTLTRDMMARFFPGASGKLYPGVISFAEWIADGAASWRGAGRPFDERDIDVLFIASDWDRPEKNYPMVAQVARRLVNRRIHVVGDVPHTLPGVTHHGFVADRTALFTLAGRARCVACPSLIDAAPGILFEASVLGCNVVASRNCGNWEMCHPDLLAEPFDLATFASRIVRATERRYEDRRGGPEWQCFSELMSVLSALARPIVAVPA